MSGYTVIDLETTGLFPQQHDRVIEIGVVYVSDTGQRQGEWTTLVNPQRDVGPTSLHGINARDVLAAPHFSDIAPHILRAVTGRTIVAHNARFDLQFLEYEFERARVPIHRGAPSMCTMQWSSRFVRGASRKLRDCCQAAGVTHEHEHSALGDARAAAGLLAHYLASCGLPVPWADAIARSRSHVWPAYSGQLPAITLLGRASGHSRPDAWLERIASNLPRNADPAIEAYLDVLEHAMVDRHLSAHEEQALIEVALSLGLYRDQLTAIHATYLDALAAAALADGVVTEDEMHELRQVAAMLGLPPRLAVAAVERSSGSGARQAAPTLTLNPGDRVVFTGELSIPRDVWLTRALAAGLEHGTVTKRTKVVVAADPDSLSGKAAKARAYGIPVVTEDAFGLMLKDLTTR